MATALAAMMVSGTPAFADAGSSSGLAPDPTLSAGPGADSPDPTPSPVAAALAQAASSGQPVTIASETTQTHELIANPDGTLSSVDNPLPVRVQQNGTWVPVSSTLTQNSDGTFSPAATPSGVILSDGGTGPLATLTDPSGNTLSYSLPFTLPIPTVSGNTALYSSVLSGVDLSVSVTDQGGFSDILIVHSAAAAANPDLTKLQFAASTQGLTLSTDAEGDLDASASNGTLSYTAPRPVMWDSNTTGDSASASQAVRALHTESATAQDAGPADATSGDGSASSAAGPGTGAQIAPVAMSVSANAVTLTPDQSMLTNPGTGYPVFIDPYTNPAGGSSNPVDGGAFDEVYSNSECSGQPMWNNPQKDQGIVGEGVGYQGVGDGCGVGLERSFYSLPISGMPTTAKVSSSTVTAEDTFAASWNCSQDQPVTLKVIGLISSNTDWNNQPGVDTRYSPVSTKVASGSNPLNPSTNCSNEPASFDVTKPVQDIVAAGHSSLTVGLFGLETPEDSSNVDFLRFSDFISITTVFDVPPDAPTDYGTDPDSIDPTGPGCGDTSTGWVGAAGAKGITFSAKLTSQMHGMDLRANYEIYDSSDNNGSGGATIVSQPSTGWVGSGDFAGTSIATLKDGHTYGWGVQAEDDASPTKQTSPWVSECHFIYDGTSPSSPTVTATDPSFPPVGGGAANPVHYAGQNIQVGVTATDPFPTNHDCTNGGGTSDTCQASGVDHFLWQFDSPPTASSYGGSQIVTSTGTDSTGAPTGSATISALVPNWGVHNLYIVAVDRAGNLSQSPVDYTFTAPWNPNTKITPGDITGDGVPDLLATSSSSLYVIPGGPASTPATTVSSGTQSPTGDSWNQYLIAHRGSLTGQSVDDLIAYNTSNHTLYGLKNDLDSGGTGSYGFTLNRSTTEFASMTKPACVTTDPTRCGSGAGFDGTDWNNLTALTMTTDIYGDSSAYSDLITVENGELWIYQISAVGLSNPVLLGSGSWSGYDLIAPGNTGANSKSSGAPTLWVRDRATGNIYTFNITPASSTGLPPLLQPPNTTVTPLVSGIAASGGGKLCLADPTSSTSAGTAMINWPCDNGSEQSFSLTAGSTIQVLGECLEPAGDGTTNGTDIDIETCNGSLYQQWSTAADGELVNTASGLCLADPDATTTTDTRQILWTCEPPHPEQNWNGGLPAALPSPPTATVLINLPVATYPFVNSPGDVNSPTGSPDGNPDLYAINSQNQLLEYFGGAPNGTTPTLQNSPYNFGTLNITPIRIS